jgi:predicted transcriptional regulator
LLRALREQRPEAEEERQRICQELTEQQEAEMATKLAEAETGHILSSHEVSDQVGLDPF